MSLTLEVASASARDETITTERAPAVANHFKAVAVLVSTHHHSMFVVVEEGERSPPPRRPRGGGKVAGNPLTPSGRRRSSPSALPVSSTSC